ncbi:ecto-NOX disulfide-thiol exchanger 2 [Ceratitis capitata]|uniref:ecto-NOX disulfide-thiol exchanger 2 n=1 Tax=Ceratitis capitata TaxID=7213 RepID=UPI0003297A92|nr:ecto-NOX disulfide-thiol exchanger 2 [Ceratitis capitata]
MLPLLGAISGGSNMNSNQNFINQLAAAITSAVGAASAANTTNRNNNVRERTPEPPPAPSFRMNSPKRVKPNRGTAPMDIESETEIEPLTHMTANNTVHSTTDSNMQLGMQNTQMFMNGGFMPPTAAAATGNAYMFYRTNAAAGNVASTTATPAAANQMFMDPTAMLAAMQQLQQNYAAGFASTMSNTELSLNGQSAATTTAVAGMKEVIKTQNCTLFPPNPNVPPPTTRERPPGCRTVFVGGLPENSSEDLIREVFESCGEITTLRSSKKNFCHIRYRHEAAVERAIYLSGYRMRVTNSSEPANFGRLHVDYAQARDDLYDYECKQRQLQREQRHKERVSTDRMRSTSPPPIPHYNEHEASLVAEHLRTSDTFVKAVQTIAVWLERGDCTKRNANMFYSMIQSTHAQVRRLHTDKQLLEDDLRKARESYRRQMLIMSTQFTQIEKVFSAASHKKVWDHFTKAQRKNIDQWKKLALELRCVQIEDDEMEMSDDDRNYQGGSAKRTRYDADSLKEENDSLRCQLDAYRSEMSHVRTDINYDNDYREKQIKVLQETIRNMQTQLLQMKSREQKDIKTIEQLQRKLKEAGVKQLLLKTKIKETLKRRDRETASINSENSEILVDEADDDDENEDDDDVKEVHVNNGSENNNTVDGKHKESNHRESSSGEPKTSEIIDIDGYKSDDEVNIIEDQNDVVEINETDDDEKSVNQDSNDDEQLLDEAEKDEPNGKEAKSATDEVSCGNLEMEDTEKPEDFSCSEKVETKMAEDDNDVESKQFLPFFEAQIIAIVAAYLIVHPFAVSTESICNYLRQTMKTLELQEATLEEILGTYTNLFEVADETETKNSELKAKWKFCGFTTTTTNEEAETKQNDATAKE